MTSSQAATRRVPQGASLSDASPAVLACECETAGALKACTADTRATELARANGALRETANQLAGAPDLAQFLERTLVVIGRELGAETAVVITYDAATDAFAYSAFIEEGRPAVPDPRASLTTGLPRDEAPFFASVLETQGGYVVYDIVRDRAQFWPGVADYLAARGLTTTVVFPIRLSGRPLGQIRAAFRVPPTLTPAQVELVEALANQAALANALRHAHARRIRVELAFTPDAPAGAPDGGVRLAITDDGRGFDPDAAHPGRFGLVGMSERAARVGAALTVVTAPGEGTEVVVMWRPSDAS